MPDAALAGFVKQTAEGLGVTGAAVGVRADGREVFACHGVTSVENPLPVTISKRTVDSSTNLSVVLAPGGGQAIRFTPAK